MNLKNRLKKFLTGLTIPQEYVCLASPRMPRLPSFFVNINNQKLDVTQSHLFLGYKPLVIALIFKTNDHNYKAIGTENEISLLSDDPESSQKFSLATLTLKKIQEKIVMDCSILFFEGIHGNHHYLNGIYRRVNFQRDKMRKQVPGNVGLPGNLADQVRIAYSLPRHISIITTSDGALVNMFPTDLHGPVGDDVYLGSLRKGGRANDQVEKYRRIVVSDVDAQYYKEAYALGKNHMKELRPENTFSVSQLRSQHFNFPLPSGAISYRELRAADSIDVGIHRIHFYEVESHHIIDSNRQPLTHIHQYYAQWRQNHGLLTQMLLR